MENSRRNLFSIMLNSNSTTHPIITRAVMHPVLKCTWFIVVVVVVAVFFPFADFALWTLIGSRPGTLTLSLLYHALFYDNGGLDCWPSLSSLK